jgi:hypothetical protein
VEVIRATALPVAWRVPLSPPSAALRFCVTATDPSGNRSRRSCAPIKAV